MKVIRENEEEKSRRPPARVFLMDCEEWRLDVSGYVIFSISCCRILANELYTSKKEEYFSKFIEGVKF